MVFYRVYARYIEVQSAIKMNMVKWKDVQSLRPVPEAGAKTKTKNKKKTKETKKKQKPKKTNLPTTYVGWLQEMWTGEIWFFLAFGFLCLFLVFNFIWAVYFCL